MRKCAGGSGRGLGQGAGLLSVMVGLDLDGTMMNSSGKKTNIKEKTFLNSLRNLFYRCAWFLKNVQKQTPSFFVLFFFVLFLNCWKVWKVCKDRVPFIQQPAFTLCYVVFFLFCPYYISLISILLLRFHGNDAFFSCKVEHNTALLGRMFVN